jgi:hypothetical protein
MSNQDTRSTGRSSFRPGKGKYHFKKGQRSYRKDPQGRIPEAFEAPVQPEAWETALEITPVRGWWSNLWLPQAFEPEDRGFDKPDQERS